MRITVCLLAICFAVGLTFGAERTNKPKQPQADAVEIECHLYYRTTPGKAFVDKTIGIDIPIARGPVPEIDRSQRKVQKFDDMTVTLLYDVNMLKLTISDPKTGEEIYGGLYQIQPGLKNQFAGGHGFTGLSYIEHPTSDAQLQTFSEVKPAE
ncbi:MAG: hypothetical protein KTR15_04640 [Phycisphaeraceae bacterium]|nr:hypothetical protein [Phycisphaeraceae bacterium]